MNLKRIKEDDLLILSELKLDLGGQDDIKQVGGAEFLLKILEKKGTMIAYCTEKWHFGAGYVQLMVHNSCSKYLEEIEMSDSYSRLYCYHFESLSTTVREYKTLKQMEFCMMAPILL